MNKTIESEHKKKDYLKYCLSHKFLFISAPFDIRKLKPQIELCVIRTNFSKSDVKDIQKIVKSNPSIEFWIVTDDVSRESVLQSRKNGVKTVMPLPFDQKSAENFFVSKYHLFEKSTAFTVADYSAVKNSKVLIVDDNLMNVELLQEVLSDFNLLLDSSLKPKEALKKLSHEHYDLILLDIMMPEMSGFELAKKIKDMPHNKTAEIVFISALSDSQNKIKGYDLGSVAYIEKPFDVALLKSQIYNLLKNKIAKDLLSLNKENFLATVAHDLKTPINAGINALKLLLDKNLGSLEGDQHEIVEDLLFSTRFMQDMVENILCKNKIDNDKIVLSRQIYSIKEIVEHCIELTKYILAPKKQKIYFFSEIENTLLSLDFLEIKRAIQNLIVNASEYSEEGSKILIRLQEKKDWVYLIVQDFGKGINLENQQDVFTEFMSMAKKNKRVGTGLGLYITKRIIEAHGGSIELESKLGSGTKITVSLPVQT